MANFNREDIAIMQKRFRTNLINSLSGFKSINLIGTLSKTGNPNLAIFSSVIHIGANPPLMGFIVRPASVPRNTYANILDTGHFTLNHITEDFFKKAHQTSAKYEADISEFDQVGLHEVYKKGFPAPFVQESPIQIGLKYREHIEIQANQTLLIIGEVQELFFDKEILKDDGYLDIEKAGSITCSGLDSYHTTQQLARLSYARPHNAITEL